MAIVRYYFDDHTVRLFEGETFRITLSNPKGILIRPEATKILRECGFRLKSKWIKTDWGWEARFSRKF